VDSFLKIVRTGSPHPWIPSSFLAVITGETEEGRTETEREKERRREEEAREK